MDDFIVRTTYLASIEGETCQHDGMAALVGPWLWKEAKKEEEKEKIELRGRHNDCHWVEVRKRIEKMERSVEKNVVG
jgi:hypothetical protein